MPRPISCTTRRNSAAIGSARFTRDDVHGLQQAVAGAEGVCHQGDRVAKLTDELLLALLPL